MRFAYREDQVLRLLCERGLNNGQIAQEMGTTEQVVKNYLRRVFPTIGVADRVQLVIWYYTGGREMLESPKSFGDKRSPRPTPIHPTPKVEEPVRPVVSAAEIRERQKRHYGASSR